MKDLFDKKDLWIVIVFQTETESVFISAVPSASVDLMKSLLRHLSFLYYYYNNNNNNTHMCYLRDTHNSYCCWATAWLMMAYMSHFDDDDFYDGL